MPTGKRMLQAVMPPALWAIGKDFKRRWFRSVDHFEYAPDGWSTPLVEGNEDFWATFIASERTAYEQLIALVSTGAPLVAHDEYDTARYAAYGYALARASCGRQTVRVLDYGGGLAHYYWIGQSLVPGVILDYHCKELPQFADAGRAINPAVQWHTDDSCLRREHDLVMFAGSLQYIQRWRDTLSAAARSARDYLLLSDVPVVQHVPTFAATQRSNAVTNVHHQFNRAECIAAVEQTGLRLIAEFGLGLNPPVRNAPEQSTAVCWIFQRITT